MAEAQAGPATLREVESVHERSQPEEQDEEKDAPAAALAAVIVKRRTREIANPQPEGENDRKRSAKSVLAAARMCMMQRETDVHA